MRKAMFSSEKKVSFKSLPQVNEQKQIILHL